MEKADPQVIEQTIAAILAQAAQQTITDGYNGMMSAGCAEDAIKNQIEFYRCGRLGLVPAAWLNTYEKLLIEMEKSKDEEYAEYQRLKQKFETLAAPLRGRSK